MSIHSDVNPVDLEVNVRNDGLIPSQPDHSVVEVPSVIGGYGVRGVAVSPLPEAIADALQARAYQQDLAMDAALSGERILALLAQLADPLVRHLPFADRIGDQPARNSSGKAAGSV